MRSLALFALFVLPGCTEPGAEWNEQSTSAPAVAREGTAPQEPGQPPPPSPDAESRQCGADKYRYLIGKHRREIPKEPSGAAWRITCTACAITQDYSPGRLNIFYDEESGIVKEVRCG